MAKIFSHSRPVLTRSGLRLTPPQEAFARAYAAFGKDTFCNGYLSLIRTREFKGSKNSAYSYASQLKSHHAVQARIQELLEDAGFSDGEVDLEHLKVIKQDKDLSNKMKGIIEYNRLKNRLVQAKTSITVQIVDFPAMLKESVRHETLEED